MARYDVTFSCGHDGVVNLVGPGKERERKLMWLGSTGLCPKCYRERRVQEQEAMPITAVVSLPAGMRPPVVEIALKGNTKPRKEEIKALGFRWSTPQGGVLDFLSTRAPQMCWVKLVEIDAVVDAIKALKGIAEQIENHINPLDLEMARRNMAEQKAKDEAVAAIEKPERPACYPAGRWNGKIYGTPRYGYRIYVDNVEQSLSADDEVALRDYRKAMAEYKARCAEVRK